MANSTASSMSRTLVTVTVGPKVSSVIGHRVLGHVGQHRRLHEPVADRLLAPDERSPAPRQGVGNVASYDVDLGRHRHRTHLGVGVDPGVDPRPRRVSSSRNWS